MKKMIGIIMGFLLVFLAGCSISITPPKENEEETPTNPSNPTQESDSSIYYLDSKDYIKTNDNTNAYQRYTELDTKIKGEANGIYQESYKQGLSSLFNIDNKLTLSIDISSSSLEELNEYHLTGNKESYALCNVDVTYLNVTVHYENVGIRQKGNTSRGEILNSDNTINLRHYKLCFSETFDDAYRTNKVNFSSDYKSYLEDRDLFGLEKLDIRWNRNEDETYLREYYAYELYRQNGILAPHSNLCNVIFKVDGTNSQNLGVYLAVEPIDKDYLKRNLVKEEVTGDLYKMGWGSGECATLSQLDDYFFGVETQYKNNNGNFYQQSYTYDLKTNKKTSTHEAIKTFISNIVNTNVDSFDTMLKQYTLYDDFITYLACGFICSDTDDLRANGNNTYLYFTTSGKAIFIPTDNDRAFGSTGGSKPIDDYGTNSSIDANRTGYLSENTSPLFTKTVQVNGNSTVKNDYKAKLKAILENNSFKYSTFKACYDKAYNNYKNDLTLGSNVFYHTIAFNEGSVVDFNSNWNIQTKKFFEAKRESLESQLNGQEESTNSFSTDVQYFLRGTVNNWGNGKEDLKKYPFTKANNYTIEVELSALAEFKIANSSWSNQYNFDNVTDTTYCQKGSGTNISVPSAGTYRITIISDTEITVVKIG